MLDRIRKLGIKVSLDDFGTGQSSLAHLRDFRFDRIKIDRSFVAEAANDPRCMAVLRATVAIGKELGVLTHAEGVETREQLDVLHDIGCDVAQGYLLGRPVVPFTDATADFAELPGDTIIGAPGDTDPQSSGVTVTRLAA